MSVTKAALIWCPFANAEDAKRAAEALLAENLIACANILPQVISVFTWNGEIQSGDEVGAIMKTSAAQLEAATNRLCELHPYEVPAIVGWVADAAPADTLNWLENAFCKGTQ